VKATIKFGYGLAAIYFAFIGALVYSDTRMEMALVAIGFLAAVVGMFFYYGKLDK
jgi:hypothetical protein